MSDELLNTNTPAEEIDLAAITDNEHLALMIDLGKGLKEAEEYGLQAEVVYSALQHAKNNPSASINECFYVGFRVWIK